MKTWRVYMWRDDKELEGEYASIDADSSEQAEEKASLEYPNFDNYEAEDPLAGRVPW
jgi:hypothetical protein